MKENFNPADKLDEIYNAIIKAGEAFNALTLAYNEYINGLNAALADIKAEELEEDDGE